MTKRKVFENRGRSDIQKSNNKSRNIGDDSASPQTCVQSRVLAIVAVEGPLRTIAALDIPEIVINTFETVYIYISIFRCCTAIAWSEP